MKRFILILALFAGSAIADTDDDITAARAAALDMAGAAQNEGFKLRDGFWSGTTETGKPKLVQVNLYAGNQYWFTAATKAGKVSLALFDESGKPMAADVMKDGARATAGFSPTASGPYYVKVELLEGQPTAFALVYSFK